MGVEGFRGRTSMLLLLLLLGFFFGLVLIRYAFICFELCCNSIFGIRLIMLCSLALLLK